MGYKDLKKSIKKAQKNGEVDHIPLGYSLTPNKVTTMPKHPRSTDPRHAELIDPSILTPPVTVTLDGVVTEATVVETPTKHMNQKQKVVKEYIAKTNKEPRGKERHFQMYGLGDPPFTVANRWKVDPYEVMETAIQLFHENGGRNNWQMLKERLPVEIPANQLRQWRYRSALWQAKEDEVREIIRARKKDPALVAERWAARGGNYREEMYNLLYRVLQSVKNNHTITADSVKDLDRVDKMMRRTVGLDDESGKNNIAVQLNLGSIGKIVGSPAT